MTVNFEKTATNEGVLHFTIEHDKALKAMKQAYKLIQKDVALPGFRKGKVTYKMFTQMYGEASLYEDALNLLKMTPHYYHIKKERRSVLDTLEALDITIDLRITVYAPWKK